MPADTTIKLALFDLNKTVYRKSSKEEFFKYICYKRSYKLLNIFQMSFFSLIKELELINKTEFKENFFNYLDELSPQLVEEFATEYWSVEWPKYFNQEILDHISQLRKKGIQVWFITGALDVYVKPLFEKFLIPDGWISTRTQYIKGSHIIIGRACKEEEKIRRLEQVLRGEPFEVVEAFSDKKEAFLYIAREAFLVKDGQVNRLSTP